jgi:glycosyltransferase involved in cell wall biosynthesis/GT2 family glycosyltransferase
MNRQPAKLNIAILTYNALDFTKMCLESIARNTKTPHNIFIHDNVSTDGTREYLAAQTQANLFFAAGDKNLGVPGGRNKLIEEITPWLPDDGYVVFLDNDMELLEGWDETYLSFFRDHPNVGIASAFGHRMLVHHYYRELLPDPAYTAPVDVACGGFCCWIRAAAIKAVGGFDESLGLFWHEDDDYSIRTMAAGFDVYALPHAPVIHHEHKSGVANPGISAGGSPKNQAYLAQKWRALGMIDNEDRAIRPVRAHSFSKHCASVDMGGYRWLEPNSSLVCSKDTQASFTLTCAKREFYPTFPFSIDISLNGSFISKITFEKSDQSHQVTLDVKSGSTVEISSSSAFHPAICGLGAHWARPASVKISKVSDGLTAHTSSLSTDAKVGLTWISSILDTDSAAALSSRLIPALARSGAVIRVQPSSVNEWIIKELAGHTNYLAQWSELMSKNSSTKTCIVVDDPGTVSGKRNFERARADNPASSKFIGFVICESTALQSDAVKVLASFDEIWVLSEPERRLLIEAGVGPSLVQIMPLGIDTENFTPGILGQTEQLVKDKFTFLVDIHSTDDPLFRQAVAAFLKTFSAQDPVCLIVTIAPNGTQLPPNYLQALIGDSSVSAETSPPVITLNMMVPPSVRAAIFRGTQCVITANRGTRRKIETLEAMACGIPVLITSIEAGTCTQASSAELNRLISEFKPNSESDGTWARGFALNPKLIDSCAQLMRKIFDERASVNKNALSLVEQIGQTASIRQTMQWISRRVGNSSAPAPAANDNLDSRTVGIDARTLLLMENIERGIGHYTMSHLSEIFRQTPSWKYILYREKDENSEALQKLTQYPNVTLGTMGDQLKDSLDLYHMPDPMTILPGYDSPLLLAPKCPASTVFYDLIPLVKRSMHLDQWEPWRKRSFLNRLKQLDHLKPTVLAISESTRKDLNQYANFPIEKITAIMAGINKANGQYKPSATAIGAVLDKYKLKSPFFMSVGGLDGHKGFGATANGYVALLSQVSAQFAVVGSFSDPYKEAYRKLFETNKIPGVVFTGYLSREEMACLYAAASALIFPSHYEGFGFPVLEAMAHGCPVITTNVSSLPEVAGDAAILVNPDDASAIANAMVRLVREPELRAQMIEKGLEQSKKFSWEICAKKTIDIWRKMMTSKI